MEYDARPSGSGPNPIILIVAGVVALLCVVAVVYFVVVLPERGLGENAGNAAQVTGAALDAAPAAGAPGGDVTLQPADWRRGFRAFAQNHTPSVVFNPLPAIDGHPPESFVRLFDAEIESAPGLEGYSGIASVYRIPNGKKVLRLHGDFAFAPTPGLTVSLSSREQIRAIGDLRAPFNVSMDVGQLDQFSGETHIVLPDGLPADALQSIAFWSRTYDVLVAAAPLNRY